MLRQVDLEAAEEEEEALGVDTKVEAVEHLAEIVAGGLHQVHGAAVWARQMVDLGYGGAMEALADSSEQERQVAQVAAAPQHTAHGSTRQQRSSSSAQHSSTKSTAAQKAPIGRCCCVRLESSNRRLQDCECSQTKK